MYYPLNTVRPLIYFLPLVYEDDPLSFEEDLRSPYLLFDEDTLYIADHQEDHVAFYRYEEESGTLDPISTIPVSSPTMGLSPNQTYATEDMEAQFFIEGEIVVFTDQSAIRTEEYYGMTHMPLQVNDLESGDLLYEGVLELDEEKTSSGHVFTIEDLYWMK